jgi:hypothetical protein
VVKARECHQHWNGTAFAVALSMSSLPACRNNPMHVTDTHAATREMSEGWSARLGPPIGKALARATTACAAMLVLQFVAGCSATDDGGVGSADLERGTSIAVNETGIRMVMSARQEGGCTAAVVGPRRLLTAAHCVASLVPGEIDVLSGYGRRAEILVSRPGVRSGKWNDEKAFDTFIVERVELSPAWQGINPNFGKPECTQPVGCEEVLGHDVAFISTTTALGGAIIPVSTEPVLAAEPVTIYGGGRTAVNALFSEFRIKKGPSTVRPREFWTRDTSSSTSFGDNGIAAIGLLDTGNFLLSAGTVASPLNTVGVRLGDSGGPVIKNGRIVGVNSMTGAVFYNPHACLSGAHATWVQTRLCEPSEGERYDSRTGTCAP